MTKNLLLCFLLVFIFSCSSSRRNHKSNSSVVAQGDALLSPSTATESKEGMPPRTLSFLWPIEGKPRIASFFGWRKKDGRKKGERMHEGLDIGGSLGQKIYASADGRVIDVAFVKGYGRTVMVYHGAGWSTLYAHLSKYKTKKSQEVRAGDVIGLMGRSGRAQAVHLHFEVRKGADPLDPLLFLPSRELEQYAPKNFMWDDNQ
jgi:murein DD-endopeptidase MepM/ murein hydrolase activator NlpD